jgi:hypothetical protein
MQHINSLVLSNSAFRALLSWIRLLPSAFASVTNVRSLIICLVCCLFFSSPLVQAQTVSKQWDKTFGGTGADSFTSLISTPDGGYLLAGSSDSGIGGDKSEESRGNFDYWIIKIASDGTKQWDKRYGGPDRDYLRLVISTSDGGYLLAGTSHSGTGGEKSEGSRGNSWIAGDYWVIKISRDGTKEWDKTFGGVGTEFLNTVIQTSDGGYLLGGSSNSEVGGDKTQEGRGESDFWLVKITATGTKQWDKTIGGTGWEDLTSFVQTPDGGYLIGGSSSSDIGYEKSEARRGPVTYEIMEPYDYWLVKISSAGTIQWDKTFGGDKWDRLSVLAATFDGGYLLAGSSGSMRGDDKSVDRIGKDEYTSDFWIIKVKGDGTKQWDRVYGGFGSEVPQSIIETSNGDYLLSGVSYSGIGADKSEDSRDTDEVRGDYWLLKLSSTGARLWDKTFGSSGLDYLTSSAPDSDGGYVLGGTTDSGPSGEKSGVSKGERDFWILKTTTEKSESNAFRINAGGTAFLASANRSFVADTYASGGTAIPAVSGEVANTTDKSLYYTGRQGGNFKYNIPTGNGTFKVVLHFNEPYFGNQVPGGISSRKFKVSMEGIRKLTDYDIFAKAGGAMKAVTETFTVIVADSILTINFMRGSKALALVSAIEVIPVTSPARLAIDSNDMETISQASVSPNPATDRLQLDLGGFAESVLSIQIADLLGNSYLQLSPASEKKQWEIPVGNLKAGMYVLKLKTAQGVQTLKFVKQ